MNPEEHLSIGPDEDRTEEVPTQKHHADTAREVTPIRFDTADDEESAYDFRPKIIRESEVEAEPIEVPKASPAQESAELLELTPGIPPSDQSADAEKDKKENQKEDGKLHS